MPIGRVKFFKNKDEGFWGIIICNDGRDLFFHGSEVQDGAEPVRDQWVDFVEDVRNGKPQAISVVPIECPPEFQCRGIVTRFGPVQKFGFIKYEKGEIFFHISDVQLINGIEYFPVKGCTVDFHISQKSNKDLAANVKITGWPPECKQTIEEYFLAVEPESEPQLELAPVVESQSELLKPDSKKKTLFQLIQERKRL